jgi:hypothetical protein
MRPQKPGRRTAMRVDPTALLIARVQAVEAALEAVDQSIDDAVKRHEETYEKKPDKERA